MNLRPLPAAQLVHHVEVLVAPLARNKNIELQVLPCDPALMLMGEKDLAAKVADNFRKQFWISPFRGLCDVVDGARNDLNCLKAGGSCGNMYFGHPKYERLNNVPVLATFGPITMRTTWRGWAPSARRASGRITAARRTGGASRSRGRPRGCPGRSRRSPRRPSRRW